MVTPDDVIKIADLARLSLSDEEVAAYAGQLGKILDHVARIAEVDVADVEPMGHAAAAGNVFREDVPEPCLDPERALANAPDHDGAYFRVPKTV